MVEMDSHMDNMELISRPVESQFGGRGNYAHSRGPLQAVSPQGISGPLQRSRVRGRLPP